MDWNKELPQNILLSFRHISEIGAIQYPMIKKLVSKGELTVVKVGTKNFIPRSELIRYLSENTIERTA